jgi:hypothetical protein
LFRSVLDFEGGTFDRKPLSVEKRLVDPVALHLLTWS